MYSNLVILSRSITSNDEKEKTVLQLWGRMLRTMTVNRISFCVCLFEFHLDPLVKTPYSKISHNAWNVAKVPEAFEYLYLRHPPLVGRVGGMQSIVLSLPHNRVSVIFESLSLICAFVIGALWCAQSHAGSKWCQHGHAKDVVGMPRMLRASNWWQSKQQKGKTAEVSHLRK